MGIDAHDCGFDGTVNTSWIKSSDVMGDDPFHPRMSRILKERKTMNAPLDDLTNMWCGDPSREPGRILRSMPAVPRARGGAVEPIDGASEGSDERLQPASGLQERECITSEITKSGKKLPMAGWGLCQGAPDQSQTSEF